VGDLKAGRWGSLVKAWPIAASALLYQLAYPPFHLSLLIFVALVPWIASLRNATGWGAFRSGYLFGILYWLVQFHWVQVLTYRWTGNLGLSLVPYVLGPLLGALYFAFFAWAAAWAWRVRAPWLIPAFWAGVEVVRSYVPELAYPWGLAALPLSEAPMLIQLAWLGTIYLVSAWVVAGNLTLALFLTEGWRAARGYALVFFLLGAFSVARYGTPVFGERTTVVAGQPGVDLAFGDPAKKPEQLRGSVARLNEDARSLGAALLILPEGVIVAGDRWPPEPPFAVHPDMPILFGGSRGTGPVYQSAFAFDGSWRFADKMRLVVFGEYVPLRGVLPFLESFRLPSGDLTPADRVSAIDVGGLRVGPLLCFETLFYDVTQAQAKNGARLLASMCIDDWYFGTSAPEQLKASAVWRAVEAGLPLVRSGSLGYSLAVDPRGRVLAEAPLNRTVALEARIAIPDRADRFPLIEVFPWAFGLCLLIPVAGLDRVRRIRLRRFPPESSVGEPSD